MKKINFIKILVFVLTFTIFFGLIVMINLLAGKSEKNISVLDREISLNQPFGSNIKDVLSKDDYLYIVVSGGNLSDRVVIFNTKSGNIISSIGLN